MVELSEMGLRAAEALKAMDLTEDQRKQAVRLVLAAIREPTKNVRYLLEFWWDADILDMNPDFGEACADVWRDLIDRVLGYRSGHLPDSDDVAYYKRLSEEHKAKPTEA